MGSPRSAATLPPNPRPLPQVTVDASTQEGDLALRATGTAVTFPGYLAAYGPPPPAAAPAGAGAGAGSESDAEEKGGEGEGEGGALSEALRRLKEGDALGVAKVGPSGDWLSVSGRVKAAAWREAARRHMRRRHRHVAACAPAAGQPQPALHQAAAALQRGLDGQSPGGGGRGSALYIRTHPETAA